MKSMKITVWVLGIILVAGLVTFGIVIGYFASGSFNIAAYQEDHIDSMHSFMAQVRDASIGEHAAKVVVPDLEKTASLSAGAVAYDSMCVMCHAAPGKERSFVGKGLFPKPPEISHIASKYSRQEIFWTLKNGLQMTGMPALGPTHSDEELWNIVAFLETLPDMTAEQYARAVEIAKQESGGHTHGENQDHPQQIPASSAAHQDKDAHQKSTSERHESHKH